jgi:hypothetical protein
VNEIDVELLRAWLRSDPPACCIALAKLGIDERSAALSQLDVDDLALLLRHGPAWWLNVVQAEHPDLAWNEAIGNAGVDVNVIRMLRSAPRELRALRLAGLHERQRSRVARALVLPRDRVLSVLDDAAPVAHLGEAPAAVLERVRRMGPAVGSWVYLVNDVEGYAGQIGLVELTHSYAAQSLTELPLIQRPLLRSALLLTDAVRLPDWQIYDILPIADDAGRFAGVVRLGDLVRALHLTDAEHNQPPFNMAMLIISTWSALLLALLGRRRR